MAYVEELPHSDGDALIVLTVAERQALGVLLNEVGRVLAPNLRELRDQVNEQFVTGSAAVRTPCSGVDMDFRAGSIEQQLRKRRRRMLGDMMEGTPSDYRNG